MQRKYVKAALYGIKIWVVLAVLLFGYGLITYPVGSEDGWSEFLPWIWALTSFPSSAIIVTLLEFVIPADSSIFAALDFDIPNYLILPLWFTIGPVQWALIGCMIKLYRSRKEKL